MAYKATLSVAPKTWGQLTNALVSEMRAQNQSDFTVLLQATSDAVQPADTEGALEFYSCSILAADLDLAKLFPDLGTGQMHLWVYNPKDFPVELSVSHA